MKSIAGSISYGKTAIDYKLLLLNRKSLEIAVHPDKSVVVKAPATASIEAITERVRKKARWINKQIAYFAQFEPRTPEKIYVGGESHLYIGKKYRLKIEKSAQDKILLKNGYFIIECLDDSSAYIKNIMDTWYKVRAKVYLAKVFDDCWEGFKKGGLEKPALKLRKMDTRWGSLSSRGRVTLNLRLIKAPKECIEYVIIHELCHLIHYNHGPEFYKLLARTMPDWMKYKHKLEMSLV